MSALNVFVCFLIENLINTDLNCLVLISGNRCGDSFHAYYALHSSIRSILLALPLSKLDIPEKMERSFLFSYPMSEFEVLKDYHRQTHTRTQRLLWINW